MFFFLFQDTLEEITGSSFQHISLFLSLAFLESFVIKWKYFCTIFTRKGPQHFNRMNVCLVMLEYHQRYQASNCFGKIIILMPEACPYTGVFAEKHAIVN